MDDLISRQAAIEVAKQHWYKPDIAGALAELPSAQPDVADENLQFTEQEKEFLCMLFSLCNEMLGMKGRYMEIDYKPFGHNELFELSQKLKIDY